MKRCPQCEFIYEDDQSLCDMDGILLVFDSQQLPKQVNMGKSSWRARVVPAVAVVVLTTVLSLVYYVSIRHRTVTQSTDISTSVNEAPIAPTNSPPVNKEDSESKIIAPERPALPPRVSETKELKALPGAEPSKPGKAKSSSTQKPTANHPPANDSKIESLVKKTGRLLKKPFKF